MSRLPILAAAALAAAASVVAQEIVVPPPASPTVEGNSSSSYPWARNASAIRLQEVYDSSCFASQGVNGPIYITTIKWRRNGAATQAAASYANTTISMSTAVNDHLSLSTTFDANHGADRTFVVQNGTVNLLPIATPTTPNDFYVIEAVPGQGFLYDPSAGDLVIDVQIPAASFTGTGSGTPDYQFGATTAATRMFSLTDPNAATATSTILNASTVMSFEYQTVPDAATAAPYGQACGQLSRGFYELFTAPNFDLNGDTGLGLTNSILLQFTGTNYVVQQGSGQWFVPQSANLALGDDTLAPVFTLPAAFPFPGGSTTDIRMGSNGFIWLDGTQTSTDLSPTAAELLTLAPRLAPFWQDLNPASTATPNATTHLETDSASGITYATWNGVVEFGQTAPNYVQVAMFPNGDVEFRWQDAGIVTGNLLVGFGGGGMSDTGNLDLSTSLPFATGTTDSLALGLVGVNRPLIGTNHTMRVTGIVPTSPAGFVFLSANQVSPGLDLAPYGMPGCFLHANIDTNILFTPTGPTFDYTLAIPVIPELNQVNLYAQALIRSPGLNAASIATSNGLRLTFGIN
jgi:hypothetical protein